MREAFSKDATPAEARAYFLHQMFLQSRSAVVLVAMLLLVDRFTSLHFSILLPISLAIVLSATLAYLAARTRQNWGDTLILDDRLIIEKAGRKPQKISLAIICSVQVDAGNCIALSWLDNDHQSTIVIGRECFSAQTWMRLTTQFNHWLHVHSTF